MGFRTFLARLAGPSARVSGRPPSGNGASSFHLTWDVPPVPLVEASATIEIIEPPTVAKLYFWALQVNFFNQGARVGGAHFGLQYHPAYPEGGAVNWGGYADAGGELDGSVSDLPSALNNINTRTYQWWPHRRYRYRVARSPRRGWQGAITDLSTGAETVVRDLWVEAETLGGPMVWSEVFADCDHPSAAVRWTDLAVTTTEGKTITVDSVRLNYQTNGDGGCANTNTSIEPAADGPGFVQRTATPRVNRTGTRLDLSAS